MADSTDAEVSAPVPEASGTIITFWWTAPRYLNDEEAAAIRQAIATEGAAAANAVMQAILDEEASRV